jgi:chemotaxis protein CheC
MQLDALREVAGIGAGHAATALSQLVDRTVALEVPQLQMLGMRDVPTIFGGPERLVLAVHARVVGDMTGNAMFMAERDVALELVDMLRGRPGGTTRELTSEDEAMIRHAATLLISAYFAAVARLADLNVLPADASLAYDMAGALFQEVFAQSDTSGDVVMVLRTTFLSEGSAADVALFFLPDHSSLEVLLEHLGVR